MTTPLSRSARRQSRFRRLRCEYDSETNTAVTNVDGFMRKGDSDALMSGRAQLPLHTMHQAPGLHTAYRP